MKLIYGKKLPDLTNAPNFSMIKSIVTGNGYTEVIIEDNDTQLKNWLKEKGFNETLS